MGAENRHRHDEVSRRNARFRREHFGKCDVIVITGATDSLGSVATDDAGTSSGDAANGSKGNHRCGGSEHARMQELIEMIEQLAMLLERLESGSSASGQDADSGNAGGSSDSGNSGAAPGSASATATGAAPQVVAGRSSSSHVVEGALVPCIPGFGIPGTEVAWGDPAVAAQLKAESGQV